MLNPVRRLRSALRRRPAAVAGELDLSAIPPESLHHFDEPSLPLQPGSIAVPNHVLRASSGTTDLAMFLGIGEAWAHLVSGLLPEQPVVLDLGCGCGKMARFLALNPGLSYLGIDLYLPAILWCRRAFAPYAGRFRFEHFNGHSPFFNPGGDVTVAEYRLPADSGTVDLAVCGSLFTHLFEPDARHYLAEIARVLKPGGRAILSLHVDVAPGETFSGSEVRIDVSEPYFLELCASAGLPPETHIGQVYGQSVHVLRAG